jgi:transcription elongation factor GreA
MTQPLTHVTAEGLEKLKAELHHLTEDRRPQIVERIKTARELGDLKENAEYHDARNEQAMLETRVQILEERIKTAEIVEVTDASIATIGTSVTVDSDGMTETWHLVGPSEADPNEYKISNESPIGAALIGCAEGQKVTAQTPGGSFDMVVTKIEISS